VFRAERRFEYQGIALSANDVTDNGIAEHVMHPAQLAGCGETSSAVSSNRKSWCHADAT